MMQPPLPALELTSTHFWLSFAPCAKFVNYFSLAHFTVLITRIPQAQADVQHLWFGRRGATRIRSQLMAAIYDKALRRKDFSGIVNKDNSKEDSTSDGKKYSKSSAEAKAKADDPKAGADIGKIVNLMAGDANRVAMTSSAMYFIYGSMFFQSSFHCQARLTEMVKVHSKSSSRVSSFTCKQTEMGFWRSLKMIIVCLDGLHLRDSLYWPSGGR
jgi:hypothetical protein